MAALLTWQNSGLVTKTGTTATTLFNDMVTLITSKSGDAAFKWEVASSSTAGPMYIVLKRKTGAAGRILIVLWVGLPAGNNSAILDDAPQTDQPYVAWFPSGNVDTPSNLTASSGTILGNDTNCVKVSPRPGSVASIYGTSVQFAYFDCDDGVVLCFQNPASSQLWAMGAGLLIVDNADNEYGCTWGSGNAGSWQPSQTNQMTWTGTTRSAGSNGLGLVRTNYGAANRLYYVPYLPGPWATELNGSAADVLVNTSTTQAWFYPIPLIGVTKGEGFALTFRQMAFGPGNLGQFTVYNTTGPVVQARNMGSTVTPTIGYAWLTNFKP